MEFNHITGGLVTTIQSFKRILEPYTHQAQNSDSKQPAFDMWATQRAHQYLPSAAKEFEILSLLEKEIKQAEVLLTGPAHPKQIIYLLAMFAKWQKKALELWPEHTLESRNYPQMMLDILIKKYPGLDVVFTPVILNIASNISLNLNSPELAKSCDKIDQANIKALIGYLFFMLHSSKKNLSLALQYFQDAKKAIDKLSTTQFDPLSNVNYSYIGRLNAILKKHQLLISLPPIQTPFIVINEKKPTKTNYSPNDMSKIFCEIIIRENLNDISRSISLQLFQKRLHSIEKHINKLHSPHPMFDLIKDISSWLGTIENPDIRHAMKKKLLENCENLKLKSLFEPPFINLISKSDQDSSYNSALLFFIKVTISNPTFNDLPIMEKYISNIDQHGQSNDLDYQLLVKLYKKIDLEKFEKNMVNKLKQNILKAIQNSRFSPIKKLLLLKESIFSQINQLKLQVLKSSSFLSLGIRERRRLAALDVVEDNVRLANSSELLLDALNTDQSHTINEKLSPLRAQVNQFMEYKKIIAGLKKSENIKSLNQVLNHRGMLLGNSLLNDTKMDALRTASRFNKITQHCNRLMNEQQPLQARVAAVR